MLLLLRASSSGGKKKLEKKGKEAQRKSSLWVQDESGPVLTIYPAIISKSVVPNGAGCHSDDGMEGPAFGPGRSQSGWEAQAAI